MEVNADDSNSGEKDAKRHCRGLSQQEAPSLETASHAANAVEDLALVVAAQLPSASASHHAVRLSDSQLMPPPVTVPKKKRGENIPSFSHFGRSFSEVKTEQDILIGSRFGFVVGRAVKWTRSDSDIPEGTWGLVKGFTTDHVRVSFPRGSWQFDPESLFSIDKVKFVDGWEVGDLVKLAEGGTGEIVGFLPTLNKIRVKSCEKTANYTRTQLLHVKRNNKFGLAHGDLVKWISADTDIPHGTEGRVVGFTSEVVCVEFRSRAWAFQITELFHVGQSRFGLLLRDSVQWLEADEDVPLGSRGEVVGFIPHRQLVTVQFPKGRFNFLPSKLVRVNGAVIFGFRAGEIVQWRSADADIPRGTLGIVTGFTRQHVRATFLQKAWNFFPSKLLKHTMVNGVSAQT